MKSVFSIFLAILIGINVFADDHNETFDGSLLNANIADEYAIYAMISSNVYHKADRIMFPVERLGWVTVESVEINASGLAYDIFERQESNQIIFAFRGTDDKKDFTKANFALSSFRTQYSDAAKHFKRYLDTHKDKNITLTGHSLGGALALSMSVNYGVDAIVFNSSPRIAEEIDETYAPAKRIMIYQDGEILTSVRKLWKKKFLTVVPRQNIYKATFDFCGNDTGKLSQISIKHRSDYLALGMLRLGATVDTKLASISEALPSN